jgi:hypothetical protein
MVLTTEAKKEMTFGVVVAAVEGGINYWAQVRGYHWHDETNEARVQVRDAYDDDKTWHQVDQDKVWEGMQKVLQPAFEVRDDIRSNIYLATVGRDDGLDAEAADVIFQAILFGEIKYS